MAYISTLVGIIYLLSCPIIVSLNIKEFDYYCAFYLMIPATSYTIYNLKRIIDNNGLSTSKEKISERKRNNYIKFFNISYVVFCIGASCLLNKMSIGAFAFFPLIIRTIDLNMKFILEKEERRKQKKD